MEKMEILNKTSSGKRVSFYKLFFGDDEQYKVRIPKIQRDYAQGRQTTEEVREQFLSTLLEYLEGDVPNRDLDFVYGSIENSEDNKIFIPLDGQQRLTTLFLLHWYFYQVQVSDAIAKNHSEDCQPEENRPGFEALMKPEYITYKNSLHKKDESMFTYETRKSSKKFCDALMSNHINLNELLKPVDKNSENTESILESHNNSDITEKNRLSKTIEDSSWFYLSWKRDPTINSMLTMLDAIHNKIGSISFELKTNFFDKLIDIKNPYITFQLLILGDFALTDELYIKMNSRGKLLTTFENFKAKLEKYLSNKTIESKINKEQTFTLEIGSDKKAVSVKEYFSRKIDGRWADLFWAHREVDCNEVKKNKQNKKEINNEQCEESQKANKGKFEYDDELMNLIRVLLANHYATISNDNEELRGKIQSSLKKRSNIPENDIISETEINNKIRENQAFLYKVGNDESNISYYKLEELGAITTSSVLYLLNTFDNLVNNIEEKNDKIFTYLSDESNFYKSRYDEILHYEKALTHTLSYRERIMLHAYIGFLIKNNDKTNIKQWLRVVYNLVKNTRYDRHEAVSVSIRMVENIIKLDKSGDILNYLKEPVEMTGFSSWQILEEKIKAQLMLKNDKRWVKAIENAEENIGFSTSEETSTDLAESEEDDNLEESSEKHERFTGQIGFILEFSGILEYYRDNEGELDWDIDKNEVYLKDFIKYTGISKAVFRNRDDYNFDNVLERALLTKGDYLCPSLSDGRKNFLNGKWDRDFNWKRLLNIRYDSNFKDEEVKFLKDKRMCVKNVLDDLLTELFDKQSNTLFCDLLDRSDLPGIDNLFDSLFNKGKLTVSLGKICENPIPNKSWRYYFIDCHDLIEYCKQGFIDHRYKKVINGEGEEELIANDNDIMLLQKKTRSSTQAELYTYYLWKKTLESQVESDDFKSFDEIVYIDAKNIYEDAYIQFKFSYYNVVYEVRIRYEDNENPYTVCLLIPESEKEQNSANSEIKALLGGLSYSWESDDEYDNIYRSSDSSDALKKIIEINKKISAEYN